MSLTSQFIENPKKLYQHLNQLRKVKRGIPKLLCDGRLTETTTEAANVLRSQYASVFTQTSARTGGLLDELPESAVSLEHVTFTPEKVRTKLLRLRPYSSPGIDNIYPRGLKTLADC